MKNQIAGGCIDVSAAKSSLGTLTEEDIKAQEVHGGLSKRQKKRRKEAERKKRKLTKSGKEGKEKDGSIWSQTQPAKECRVRLTFDGSWRPQQNSASCSCICTDPEGKIFLAIARKLPAVTDNLVAQSWGLIEGLDMLNHLGYTRVKVRGDGKALLDALRGVHTPKVIEEDVRRIKTLATGMRISFRHIKKSKNDLADALARLGHNQVMQLPGGLCCTSGRPMPGGLYWRSRAGRRIPAAIRTSIRKALHRRELERTQI